MQARYRVTLWEMERGWGSRFWSERDFESLAEARAYQQAENAKNTESSAPDWYVRADDPVLVDAEINPPRQD